MLYPKLILTQYSIYTGRPVYILGTDLAQYIYWAKYFAQYCTVYILGSSRTQYIYWAVWECAVYILGMRLHSMYTGRWSTPPSLHTVKDVNPIARVADF